MSVIEDSRKVLQDFIEPELRAIDARLTSLEKRFDETLVRTDKRFDEAQARTDKQFDELGQRMEQRFEQVLSEIRQLKTVHDLELRMARYEAALKVSQTPARSESEAA